MKVFTVYIFNEYRRSDKKKGDLVIIVPVAMNEQYSLPLPGYRAMTTMAESVYSYDIDDNNFHTYKNRHQIGSGYKPHLQFDNIVNVNVNTIWFMNDYIGEEKPLNQLLVGHGTPHQLYGKKYCEIPLAGMTHVELYLSVLSGYYGEDDEICSDI